MYFLIGTFVVVGIIHIVSLKTIKISESKKSHFRKLFWYFYGIFLTISGGVTLFENKIYIGLIYVFLGLIIIILNFLGKIETKKIEADE